MIIDSVPLWAAATNCYVIAPEVSGPAIIVDAPPDPTGILELLTRHDLAPVALLATHGHVDHVGGAGVVSRWAGVTAYVHPDDDFLTLDPVRQLQSLFGSVPPGEYAPPDTYTSLEHGQQLTLAGIDVAVLHTPGHTPGHCCFSVEADGILFSGDQLFAGSIGRTDLPGGDTAALMQSMRQHVMTLEDDVRVLPGHGPATTVGHERSTNPFRSGWEL